MGCKLAILACLLSCMVNAQEKIPGNYFRSPLGIDYDVTGTFGEPRKDHLHSGIDFNTQNKTGLEVYAVADGYVSRIKVSAGGYGRVIYLTHPNGLVSVYAHLDQFNVVIDDYVNRRQYEKESFEIELFPHPALFRFRKGEVVGYSGNSGSSTGPHLHFEIRHEKSEKPVNPALFGFYSKDLDAPIVYSLRVYPSNEGDSVNGKASFAEYGFEKGKNSRICELSDTVEVAGACYFGVMTEDIISANKKCGPYTMSLFIDSSLCFYYKLDSFAFDENRYVNDMIDYAEYEKSQKRYIVSKISPGNALPIYMKLGNEGVLRFRAEETHHVFIKISDYAKNTCYVTFFVRGKPAVKKAGREGQAIKELLFAYGKPNHFETADLMLDIPANALYDSVYFTYRQLRNPVNHYSSLHRIHDAGVPLHKSFEISISADSVPVGLRNKALIARYSKDRELISTGGTLQKDRIRSKAWQFGDYLIAVDTLPPVIRPLNLRDSKNINEAGDLQIYVRDDLSGIDKYRAEVNGKWVLMEYDPKNDQMNIPVDNRMPKGETVLLIKVSDKCGNEAVMKYQIYR